MGVRSLPRARFEPPAVQAITRDRVDRLFDRAWEVLHRIGVRRDDHLGAIHDPRWEDACSEAVLAILEGRDPEAAARAVLATERRLSVLSVRIADLERLPAGV